MAICKNCKGVGYIIEEDRYSSYQTECWECDGKGVVEPMTEQEYLQTCTTEQLAKEIYECVMTHPWHISKEVILEWLKQPRKPIS